jgi:hypothetical protein
MATVSAVRWQYIALQQDLWQRLGPQKWLAGRDMVNAALKLLVLNWPYQSALRPEMQESTLRDLREFACAQMASYKGRKKRYGFVWTMILSAVIGQLVRLLLEWWLEDNSNKTAMEYMRVLREGNDG